MCHMTKVMCHVTHCLCMHIVSKKLLLLNSLPSGLFVGFTGPTIIHCGTTIKALVYHVIQLRIAISFIVSGLLLVI